MWIQKLRICQRIQRQLCKCQRTQRPEEEEHELLAPDELLTTRTNEEGEIKDNSIINGVVVLIGVAPMLILVWDLSMYLSCGSINFFFFTKLKQQPCF